MKKVLFIPGFQEDINSRDYASTIKTIEQAGYEVEFVDIQWKRTLPSDWVSEFEKTYSKYDPKNTVLAGFSYGAVTALLAASHKNPAELWLFSLSPYFAEDLPSLTKSWLTHIGHRRVSAFEKLKFTDIAKSINCKTLIISGDKENKKYPPIYKRAVEAEKLIKNAKYVIAKDSGHDVTANGYLQAIKENIRDK